MVHRVMIIGIDPGVGGAIAWQKNGDSFPQVINMPGTQLDILNQLREIKTTEESCECIIEEVHCFPGEAVQTAWVFSGNYHSLKMALLAAGIRFKEVSPQCWQKALKLISKSVPRAKNGSSIEEKKKVQAQRAKNYQQHKRDLKERAQQLFPDVKVTLKNADALLILEYAKSQ